MKKIIFKSETRGRFQNEWLNTRYSFSFADYFDKERMNFGALRVLNDDIILPGQGFGKHPHDNMEIITIPLRGKLSHLDSMGHQQEIAQNEVQVMTAGTGIFHAEFNASKTDEVSLLQIWIYPSSRNYKPAYSQKYYEPKDAQNLWQILATGDHSDDTSLHINQKAKISRIFLSKDKTIDYQLNEDSFGCFIFQIEGNTEIANDKLFKRDAIGIYETRTLELHALTDSYILNIEVPER